MHLIPLLNNSFDFNCNYIWLHTPTNIQYLWLEYLYIHEAELHLIVHIITEYTTVMCIFYIYIFVIFLYKYWKLCQWNKWVISGGISLKCYAYCCILCICCSLIMDASLTCTELATCMMMGGMQFFIVIWIAVHAIVFLMQYISQCIIWFMTIFGY